MKNYKERVKSEEGSISSVILVTVLFFITILTTGYMVSATLRKSQLKSEIATRDIYEQDIKNVSKIYNVLLKKMGKLPSTDETKPYFPGSDFSWVDGTDLDNGLVVEDDDRNQYVWIEVPKTATVYKTATINIVEGNDGKFTYSQYGAIEKDLQDYTSVYRNSTSYSDIYYSDTNTGWFKDEEEYNTLKQSMLKSVYEHGGFWIGRYETGYFKADDEPIRDFGTDALGLHATTQIPVIQANAYPYTWVRRTQAQVLANSMNSGNYTSSLMFGVQWDLVLKYIDSKKAATELQLNNNSTDIGNYYNSQFKINRGKYAKRGALTTWYDYTEDLDTYVRDEIKQESMEVLLTTGASDKNRQQNIYDIAGNIWEWTLEKNSAATNPCSIRGSCFNQDGSLTPASFRSNGSSDASNYNLGFRVSIY